MIAVNSKSGRARKIRFAILRAVGLDALNALWSRIWGSSSDPEPKKRIVKRSFWTALARSAVHLIPSAASIAILYFNLAGYFIGFEMAGLKGLTTIDMALLQVAAKVQELLVLASVAAVIFDEIRHKLLDGQGIPFGLLGSGILFTQMSYFWSPDFVGAVTTKSNARLLLLLCLGGLLALVTGPSVAILIIPRTVTWPAGGTPYYIDGAAADLWPSAIDLTHYTPAVLTNNTPQLDCGSPDGRLSGTCPSGGFGSFKTHFTASMLWEYPQIEESLGFSGVRNGIWNQFTPQPSGVGILVESSHGTVAPYTMSGSIRGWSALETSSFAVHGATINLQKYLNFEWYEGIMGPGRKIEKTSRYRFYATQQSAVQTQIPAVRVVCQPAQRLPSGSTTVVVPTLPAFGANSFNYDRLLYTAENNLNFLSNITSSDFLRVSFFTPDPYDGYAATTGLLFEAPWDRNNSRLVSACTIDARWANATVFTQYPQAFQSAIEHPRPASGFIHSNEAFLPQNNSAWRGISVSEDWLNAINFELPAEELGSMPPGTTSIEALINSTSIPLTEIELQNNRGNPNSLTMIEHIIASVFADALARVGSYRSFNNSIADPDQFGIVYANYQKVPDFYKQLLEDGTALVRPSKPESSYTTFNLKQTITGYGYKARSVTDILAVAVLFLHLGLAITHTALLLIRKRSSGCWDTISELMALAIQSTPSENALQNTCAGIVRIRNFKEKVRIHTTSKEHLELSFQADQVSGPVGAIDLNEKYGGSRRESRLDHVDHDSP